MPLLTELRLALPDGPEVDAYPFTVPAIRALDRLDLRAPVTCFVGENGSGKSTLLEGMAAAARLPAVGSDDVDRDPSLAAARLLARHLVLSWTGRTGRGFFLRAEDFTGFSRRLARDRAELEAHLAELGTDYEAQGRSAYALGLAQGPARASLHDMERRYGVDLDASSHGQAFLRLFGSRLVPSGLYLLDEPEAALSPQSQLGLLATMLELARAGAQFVVATHSPILLAYPGARIYSFDAAPPEPADYAELEHVRLTRDFLADPGRFLRHL